MLMPTLAFAQVEGPPKPQPSREQSFISMLKPNRTIFVPSQDNAAPVNETGKTSSSNNSLRQMLTSAGY
jgi:hypothetical protein